jgi:hypothetical protein
MEARVTKVASHLGKVLEVFGETPISSEPAEGALDPPSGAAGRQSPSCRRSA